MAIAATVSGMISRSRLLARGRDLTSNTPPDAPDTPPLPPPDDTSRLTPPDSPALTPHGTPQLSPLDGTSRLTPPDRPPLAPPRTPDRLVALIAVCAALPFVVSTIVVLARPSTFALRGDSAVIELAVRNAAAFAQHLGPYSRFGWTHPGPLWFYALAPIYVLGEIGRAHV